MSYYDLVNQYNEKLLQDIIDKCEAAFKGAKK